MLWVVVFGQVLLFQVGVDACFSITRLEIDVLKITSIHRSMGCLPPMCSVLRHPVECVEIHPCDCWETRSEIHPCDCWADFLWNTPLCLICEHALKYSLVIVGETLSEIHLCDCWRDTLKYTFVTDVLTRSEIHSCDCWETLWNRPTHLHVVYFSE